MVTLDGADHNAKDNPAGRLHRILVRMKQVRGNVPVMNGMADALSIVPAFLPDVARGVAEVFSLAVETEGEVRSLGDDQPKDLLLQWHPKVMDALNAMFFQRSNPPLMLDQVTALYGTDDLLSLEFCSAALHRARRELMIERDALARVKEQIVDLLGALESDADLDRELQGLLLRNVRAMLRACDSYDRSGTSGIRDAANQTVGALINNPVLVARAESSPKSWQKTVAVLALVTSMVNLGNAAVTAIEKAGAGHPAQIVMVPAGRELPPGTGAADSASRPTELQGRAELSLPGSL